MVNRAGAPQPIPVAASTKSMSIVEHETNADATSQCSMWLDQSPGFRRLGYYMEQARSACEQPKMSFRQPFSSKEKQHPQTPPHGNQTNLDVADTMQASHHQWQQGAIEVSLDWRNLMSVHFINLDQKRKIQRKRGIVQESPAKVGYMGTWPCVLKVNNGREEKG